MFCFVEDYHVMQYACDKRKPTKSDISRHSAGLEAKAQILLHIYIYRNTSNWPDFRNVFVVAYC